MNEWFIFPPMPATIRALFFCNSKEDYFGKFDMHTESELVIMKVSKEVKLMY